MSKSPNKPITQEEVEKNTLHDFNRMAASVRVQNKKIQTKMKADKIMLDAKQDQPLGRYFPGLGAKK
jgi:hypothetical protein